jgi:hypothetical protein
MPRTFPQGLKPVDLEALTGTDKSVPFQNTLKADFFSILLSLTLPPEKE